LCIMRRCTGASRFFVVGSGGAPGRDYVAPSRVLRTLLGRTPPDRGLLEVGFFATSSLEVGFSRNLPLRNFVAPGRFLTKPPSSRLRRSRSGSDEPFLPQARRQVRRDGETRKNSQRRVPEKYPPVPEGPCPKELQVHPVHIKDQGFAYAQDDRVDHQLEFVDEAEP
jgi:hypothetical protein